MVPRCELVENLGILEDEVLLVKTSIPPSRPEYEDRDAVPKLPFSRCEPVAIALRLRFDIIIIGRDKMLSSLYEECISVVDSFGVE